MTDQGQGTSRRARRAAELQASQSADGGDAFAQALATGEIPVIGPDGKPLSRRDRRRLERSDHPMETWTAEEERIATGQMPAMTPEVIAQQERLEREKAERASAEAAAASLEMRRVAGLPAVDAGRAEDISRGADAAASSAPAWLADVMHPAPQEPTSRPGGPLPLDGVPTPPEIPIAQSQPTPDAPVTTGGIPEAFKHMFPPGSLQARMMESQDAAPGAEPEVTVPYLEGGGVQPAGAESGDQGAPPAEDPADEIRRLTAAAMAGMDRSAEPSQQPEATPSDSQVTNADRYGEQLAGLSGEQPQAPQAPSSGEQAVPGFTGFGAAAQATPPAVPAQPEIPPWEAEVFGQQGAEPQGVGEPVAQFQAPQPEPPPFQEAEPAYSPFSDIVGTDAALPAQSGVFPPAFEPEQPQVDPAWAAHPLSGAQPVVQQPEADAASAAYPATGEIVHPDLSALNSSQGGFNPPTGGFSAPVSGQFGTGAPISTGSIEVARRESPELLPAGGARHFGFPQLAVIGAIAFALGVVVWHVAGPGL